MNLNPFELRNNDYYVKDMYMKDKDGWSWLSVVPEVGKQLNEYYGSYEYLLKGINLEIDWKSIVYTGSYQGELYCLGESKDGKVYYVNTGYGSCSGCDWYQAQDGSIEGLQEIQNSLKKDIKEFNNVDDFIEWFTSDERNYNEWYGKEERDEFLNDVREKYNTNK